MNKLDSIIMILVDSNIQTRRIGRFNAIIVTIA